MVPPVVSDVPTAEYVDSPVEFSNIRQGELAALQEERNRAVSRNYNVAAYCDSFEPPQGASHQRTISWLAYARCDHAARAGPREHRRISSREANPAFPTAKRTASIAALSLS